MLTLSVGRTVQIGRLLQLSIFWLCWASSVFVKFSEARTSKCMKVQLPHGGTLVGRHMTTVNGRHMRAFLGVPYAKPPIDELRFKPPEAFGSWKGERLAIQDSQKCTQRDPFRRDMEIEGSEDCLYLNVYTPEFPRTKAALPVMVWFHGGGWECGSGISSYYGPDFLMDHDIIYVGANFRLGPLGFLSTETLDCPGNFGLKDQLEVLKWIQTNIAAFGGNPKSVTVFGESAGGASVTYHMLSKQSKGLFHRGIAQSGTYFNPWAQPAHKGVPSARAREVARLVDCNVGPNWQKVLKCLRQRSAANITATFYELFKWDTDPMIPFPPVVEPDHEGAFLTELPRSQPSPHGLSLPLMIGLTSDEGVIKTASLLNMPDILRDFRESFYDVLPIILNYDHHEKKDFDVITEQIKQFYFSDGLYFDKNNHTNLTDLISDGWFMAGIDEYLRLRMNALKTNPKQTGNTYVYLFEHKGAASFSEIFKGGSEEYYGASHAEELQFLFPIGKELFVSASPTKEDIAIRNALVTMWVNFANSSNPTTAESSPLDWPASTKYPVSFVRLGSKNIADFAVLRRDVSMLQDRADFWHQLKPHLPAAQRLKDEL